MKTRFLSTLALAALPFAAAMAEGNMEVYGEQDEVVKTFALDDVASVKFVDQEMTVSLKAAAGAPAESPFTIATAKVTSVKFKMGQSAAPEIEAEDASAPAVYYTLQGMRADNPTKGNLYIRVQGKKATKVIF